MTKKEFKQCFAMAQQGSGLTPDEMRQAEIALCGFGLEPKIATKAQCAYMINYQTMMMNGARDQQMIEECYHAMLRYVTLID